MKKLLIIFGVVVVLVLGLAWKMNKDSKVAQRSFETQQKKYQDSVARDYMVESLSDKLGTATSRDVVEKLVDSEKLSQSDKSYYANIAREWKDALEIASSSPRISLAQPIKDLQAIRNKLQSKEVSSYCDSAVRDNLALGYGYAVDSFLDFMKNDEQSSSLNTTLSVGYMDDSLIILNFCSGE